MAATLAPPPTNSRMISDEERDEERDDAMGLLGFATDDLEARQPPACIHGGADHIVFAFRDRARLAAMAYDLDAGPGMMRRHSLVTIMLVHIEDDRSFSVRDAFASGGILEDPATGAAAAAFAGYLRDLGWPDDGQFTIRQGEDMGASSLIQIYLSDEIGSSVRVSGDARLMQSI